jgi:phosphatidylinositol-bisphosphatase
VSKHLVGILLTIYVKSELFVHIKDIQIDTVGTGIMGVGGNKGGVGMFFKLC